MSNHPNRSKHTVNELRSPSPKTVLVAREASGLTQTQAAHLIGVTITAWQRWEAGEREMQGGMFELFERRVAELPGRKYGLGTPSDPIPYYDIQTGQSFTIGNGWMLADVTVGAHQVALLTSPTQTLATLASIMTRAGSGASYRSCWRATPESAVEWLREQATHDERPAVEAAVLAAAKRYPPLAQPRA